MAKHKMPWERGEQEVKCSTRVMLDGKVSEWHREEDLITQEELF